MVYKKEQLEYFRCPVCIAPLIFSNDREHGNNVLCKKCNTIYGSFHDHPDFLGDSELQHPGRWVKFMRGIYAKVYTPVTNLMFLPAGGAGKARIEVLERLEVNPGDRVLETGMGAGDNLPYLHDMFEMGEYHGLDIQKQMIRLCSRNLKKWDMEAVICRADAESLPYPDESFDCVFHLGAINLFIDKKKAIDEMIRVAKGGTKIVIADESEKAGKLINIFMGKQEEIVPPVDLVPDSMEDINLEYIWRDYGYLIEFRKPLGDSANK